MTEEQFDKLSKTFKLEPGPHIYLIEVKVNSMINKNDLAKLANKLDNIHINVQFVITAGDGFSMRAVPSIETNE